MANQLWTGVTGFSKDMLFIAPPDTDFSDKPKTSLRCVDGVTYLRSPSIWFTNLDHGRRHQPLVLMTMADNLKHSRHKQIKGKKKYEKYDNYNAIEIPFTDAIPSDYKGAMGVPISFLDKYNPEQFEILGATESEGRGFSNGLWNAKSGVSQPLLSGVRAYKRIFIKHKGI